MNAGGTRIRNSVVDGDKAFFPCMRMHRIDGLDGAKCVAIPGCRNTLIYVCTKNEGVRLLFFFKLTCTRVVDGERVLST
jgi:hypothetical protein